MMYVRVKSTMNAAQWIAYIFLHSRHETQSNLRDAWKRNRKLVAPLIAALLSLLPLLFSSSFFPSIPRGGWMRANLIERQINKEIYCHLSAPPS